MFFRAHSLRDVEDCAARSGEFAVPIEHSVHPEIDVPQFSEGSSNFEHFTGPRRGSSHH